MRNFITNHERLTQRSLEMLPGTLTWTLILFPLWGAFFIPKIVAYFTIAFLVYWLYRSCQSAILGIRGYLKIRHSEKTNWRKKYLQDKNKDSLPWNQIKHVVLIPNCNESVVVLAKTQKDINLKQMVVVLG